MVVVVYGFTRAGLMVIVVLPNVKRSDSWSVAFHSGREMTAILWIGVTSRPERDNYRVLSRSYGWLVSRGR